jgi:glyoxylase-like metal-dependent hydrolase (beta-lactamase superfamily II)
MSKVIKVEAGMSNMYFVRGRKTIVVDSGALQGTDPFLEICTKNSVDPRDISLIVITHGHVDHFLNAGVIREVTNAPILCHKNAEEAIREGLLPDAYSKGRTTIGAIVIQDIREHGGPISNVPKTSCDIVIEGDYDLTPWGVAGKIIETPGHTNGCVSVVLDTREAFVGDLIVEPPGTGKCGLPFLQYIGSTDTQVYASVMRLLELADTFYSRHGGPFTREEVLQAVEEDKTEIAASGRGNNI